MKPISPQKRAKVRVRFEIAASAILATILVTTVMVLATPGYFAALQQIGNV